MKHLIEFEKYFAPEEVLLAGELWDRLSGEKNTMEKLLKIINDIAQPDFMEKFEFINKPLNFEKDRERYIQILESWCLFDEVKIFKNYDFLKAKVPRILFQPLFKETKSENGKYNVRRKERLLFFLSHRSS